VGDVHEGDIFILEPGEDNAFHLRRVEGAKVGEESDDLHVLPALEVSFASFTASITVLSLFSSGMKSL